MLDQVRYIQRDGQSVDIAIVRQRFFETALDARRRSRQGVRHLERRGISGISMRDIEIVAAEAGFGFRE
jgi:hypothetical protein